MPIARAAVQLLPLLLLFFIAASPAQSAAVATASKLCLSQPVAKGKEGQNTVICGFPLTSADTSVPLACSREVSKIQGLLSKEAGLQALKADEICYYSYTPDGNKVITLNADDVSSHYKASSSPVKVRLLDSVSDLVGASPMLTISGNSLVDINPAVFADIGPAQKAELKNLFFVNTNLTSIDISLLKPLGIQTLMLQNNFQLSRITNYQGVSLPDLQELVLFGNSKDLVDCRSFLSLQSGLKKIFVFDDFKSDSCAFCHLPTSISEVMVKASVTELPFHPGVQGTQPMPDIPFPITNHPYQVTDGTTQMYKVFTVSQTKPAQCSSACSCQAWPKQEEVQKTSGISGGSSSGTEQAVSDGKASVGAGSRPGAGSRLAVWSTGVGAAAAVTVVAMAWASRLL